ncbi:hypothetical protein [Huintestinicola sp.]|uniref:hypothetical protein n=1 Tax=Huintestinicola sp. TaxID=2981661 RepID=UPI003D7D5173
MKRKNMIILLSSICMLLSACSDNGDTQLTETLVITNEERTDVITEETVSLPTEAAETENQTEETEAVVNDTSADTEVTLDMMEELTAEASRLMGALDYIDCIGGGNIPKDENDTVEQDGRQYARVAAQFENTADLEEYMTENLSDELIQSRYSHILGGEQPYYIDVDGVLYGYVTAKGCGFPWITEDGEPVISITDVSDSSFTAVTKFDNFGGECEMQLNIIFTDGLWKITSISYDGMTF